MENEIGEKEIEEFLDLLEKRHQQELANEKIKERNKNKNNRVKVHCQCNYCAYEKEGLCNLEEIVVGTGGVCQNCVMINVSSDDIEKAKEEFLSRKEKRPNSLKELLELLKQIKEEIDVFG